MTKFSFESLVSRDNIQLLIFLHPLTHTHIFPAEELSEEKCADSYNNIWLMMLQQPQVWDEFR
jgi:hypothetical protein